MTKKVKISNGLTWTYGYDHRNQLIEVQRRTTDGGTLEEDVDFQNDAYGNRLIKIVDENGDGDVDYRQRYGLDGWNSAKPSPLGNENWDVWADLNGGYNLQTRYLRGDVVDQLFARIKNNGDAFWYFGDHLGSIRDITNDTGVVKDSLTYDGFGNITAETDPAFRGRYAWTGREYDVETDLQYNRARYYDAKIGRWISQDPLGFEAGDNNLYRYVKNIPTIQTDPNGMDFGNIHESYLRTYSPPPPIIHFNNGKKAYLSKIKISFRNINPAGLNCLEGCLATCFGCHTNLAYGDKSFGLFNTKSKKGDLAQDEKHLPFFPPYAYISLYKPDWVNLPGTNTKLSDATDDQIWKSLTSHKLTSDYNELTYNCDTWAHEAVTTVGLYRYSRHLLQPQPPISKPPECIPIPGFCFVAGTKVITDKGLRPIEDIQTNELVLTWNENSSEFEFKPVVKLIRAKKRYFILIQGKGWSILCTLEHPFLVDGKWKVAEKLAKGDVLMGAKGARFPIEFVTKITSDFEINVFNFTVKDNHTYCVTEQGIVVHNK